MSGGDALAALAAGEERLQLRGLRVLHALPRAALELGAAWGRSGRGRREISHAGGATRRGGLALRRGLGHRAAPLCPRQAEPRPLLPPPPPPPGLGPRLWTARSCLASSA